MDSRYIKKLSRRFTFKSTSPSVQKEVIDKPSTLANPQIFEYLSKFLNPKFCKRSSLFLNSVHLLQRETGATHAEILIIKKNKLKLCSESLCDKLISLNPDDNLPSYCITTKEKLIVTNPHTCSAFHLFKDSNFSFKPLEDKDLKVSSLACLPFYVFFI